MNGYKKLFKSKTLRFRILAALRFIPDKPMLKLQYRIKCGRKLDLKDPKRYSEKLQWYKLYYRDPVMQRCADKYLVREYVGSKGLGHILNELYAVYESPEDIRIEDLPERFVLKLSNGSSTNLMVTDKNSLDMDAMRKMFHDFYAESGTSAGREWVYQSYRKPVIVAERYLEDPSQKDGSLCDYKILCFSGKPCYVVCDVDRFTDHRRNIYDPEWNDLRVSSDCPCTDVPIPRPSRLEEMVDIARILSADFPAVRVDLYEIDGQIYFGEMTFFPWSGYVLYDPDSFDYQLGACCELPPKNN
jgi:hypothetical protein